jgi:hypothetical protein
MRWPVETNLLHSYRCFIFYRQPSGFWFSTEGQTELQRLLTSQNKEEIIQGLFACAGIKWENIDTQLDTKYIPLDKVESLLFHDDPTIWAAAAFAFALIRVNQKVGWHPLSATLNRLLMLWLNNDCDKAQMYLSATFCRLLDLLRHEWEPVLSDAQIQRIHQLAEPKPKDVELNYFLGACIIVAFHAKNVWTEDELANRLAALKTNDHIFFRNLEDRDLSIDNMLKQMGEAGRKYIISEKPPRRKKKS